MSFYFKTVILASLAGSCVFAAMILTGPDGLTWSRFAVAATAYIATLAGLAWTIGRWSKT